MAFIERLINQAGAGYERVAVPSPSPVIVPGASSASTAGPLNGAPPSLVALVTSGRPGGQGGTA
jgi:hypothetical protein